jgi:hypothetical protein
MVPGEQQRALGAHGEADDDRAIGLRRVHDRDGVRRELWFGVRLGLSRPVRAAVAASVEREHAAMPGQVRHLHLPVSGVDDRPGR